MQLPESYQALKVQVVVPAGKFEACRITFNEGASAHGVSYYGNISFGLLKQVAIDYDGHTSMAVSELESISH